ncbi:MAG: hypothetical protein IKV00_04865 [Clostridia bacterium]|nr:hypothetical protein [Clostridia bacterium]
MGKARKHLGLGLVCAALVFLFNPMISVIDVLPDCIGYLLLCMGITQLADMDYHFEEALKYFKRMLIASAIQLGSVLVIFGLVTDRERPTAFLLLAFIFSVVELIFMTHAFRCFYEGFLYTGSRLGSTAVFAIDEKDNSRYEEKCRRRDEKLNAENRKRASRGLDPLAPKEIPAPKSATVKAARLTTAFIIAKVCLTVLPEMAALSLSSYDETTRFSFLYNFIPMFRRFAVLIGIPVGIVWLVRIRRYVRSLMADRPYMATLKHKYVTEIEPKTYIFIQRAIKLAFAVMSVGIVFCADMYMESNTFNILPDTLCALILIGALLLLRKFVKVPVYTYLLCGIYAALSTVTFVVSSRFFTNYTLNLTNIREEAHNAFLVLQVTEIADAALFFAMLLSLLPVLSAIIKQYTGFAPVSGGNVQYEDKVRYVHAMLRKRLIVMAIMGALCLVSGICYILLVKNVTFMWIVDFLVCGTLAVYTILTLNAIVQEVEYKYLLN